MDPDSSKLQKQHIRNMFRRNVYGVGADRKSLLNFQVVGVSSQEFRQQIMSYTVQHSDTYNDIWNEQRYKIAATSALKDYFPATYRQILLQHPLSTGESEEDYQLDQNMQIMQTIRKIFYRPYRTRIAILPKNETLGWHIDTNTSVSCRFHIPIQGKSLWKIRRGKEIEERILEAPGIWFVNTGFAHEVSQLGDEDRITVIVGSDWKNVSHLVYSNER